MLYVTASYLYTPKPEQTQHLLTDILGFTQTNTTPALTFSNGSTSLCLAKGNTPAMLTLQCSDIAHDAQWLLQHPNIHQRTAAVRMPTHIEQHLYCDEGITLILFQPLSEDDTGELPPLPTTLAWSDSLIHQAQHILKVTPLAFRDKARQAMTERAEYLSIEAGEVEVSQPHVIQAFIEVTPPFQHQALYEAMKEQGMDADACFDPSQWQA